MKKRGAVVLWLHESDAQFLRSSIFQRHLCAAGMGVGGLSITPGGVGLAHALMAESIQFDPYPSCLK